MAPRDRKLQAFSARSPAKALVMSRRLVQSTKQRLRKPFYSEYFKKGPSNGEPDAQKPAAFVYDYPPPLSPDQPPQLPTSYPLQLPKPQPNPISLDAIATCDPEMKDLPLDYLRKALVLLSPRMLGAFKEFRAEPPEAAIPPEMNVLVTDYGLSCMPTHVLAVYSPPDSAPPSPSRVRPEHTTQAVYDGRKVTLYPVHGIVLLAHCSTLPRFPPSRPRAGLVREGTPTTPAATAYKLPVVPLRVPKDYVFLPLLHYLYSLNQENLLASLIPIGQPPAQFTFKENTVYADVHPPEPKVPREKRITDMAVRIIRYYEGDMRSILRCAQRVESVWRNGVALGVTDDGFWDTINLAWASCVGALKIHHKSSHEFHHLQVARLRRGPQTGTPTVHA